MSRSCLGLIATLLLALGALASQASAAVYDIEVVPQFESDGVNFVLLSPRFVNNRGAVPTGTP